MNAAAEIVAELRARGIHDEPRSNGGVRLAPAHLIDSGLRNRIIAHKNEVIARLRADQEQTEFERIARLDRERRERDRLAKRGYDFDPTAPGHAEYIPPRGHPAWSILETCRCYGVALRIDPDGALVVGRAGATADEPSQPWPSLLIAIEAHLEAVARLVAAGWHLSAVFPQTAVT
jgi:hypothetical protein